MPHLSGHPVPAISNHSNPVWGLEGLAASASVNHTAAGDDKANRRFARMAAVRQTVRNEGGRPPVYALSDFGERLKTRLDRRGWSRNTLARETGINGSTLWRWMVGQASPPLDKLVQIASTVGCQPADLLPKKTR